jgi:hypothetical protein
MNKVKNLLEDMFPMAWEGRFRSSILAETAILTATIVLDMFSSILMMTLKGPQLEGNLSFRELYTEPNLFNTIGFLKGQFIYICPILIAMALAIIPLEMKEKIASIGLCKCIISELSYIEHILLVGFSFLRFYGTITNIIGMLIDFPLILIILLMLPFSFVGFLLIMRFTVIRNMNLAMLQEDEKI